MPLEDSENSTDSSNSIIYLNISLYFAILAFFIVLTVLSQSNTVKSNNILNSVQQEFKGKKRSFEEMLQNPTLTGVPFRDSAQGFIEKQKASAQFKLSESSISYTLKTPNLTFFSSSPETTRDYFSKFSRDISDIIAKTQKHENATANFILRFNRDDEDSYIKTMNRLASLKKIMTENKVSNIKLSALPWSSDLPEQEFAQTLIIFNKNDF